MGQNKTEQGAAWDMACVRKEILTFCEALPQIIKTHGSNCMGDVVLSIGRCFLIIGHKLDKYSLHQPLPGVAPMPRIQDLGEQLRVAGLELLNNPTEGDLKRTADALRAQADILCQIAINATEGKQ